MSLSPHHHPHGRPAPGPPPVTTAERAAMRHALALAARGPAEDPNPRVGCVILGPDTTVIGEGFHRGAGTPHAEVAALAQARARGHDPRGATAVVTLEPCRHTGRTGPCTIALLAAGITRVVYGVPDPGASSGGGADLLAGAGVEIVGGVSADRAAALIADWHHRAKRPPNHPQPSETHVILKTAATLDGRIAAADGSSRWITGAPARAHAHAVRAHLDALVVGTGTVLADDPALTSRPLGFEAPRQPWRVVVGRRPVPARAAVRRDDGRLLHVATHDPHEVLAALRERGARRVLVEGGPTLATAFLRAGVVDEIHAYLAPLLLGAGPSAVGDLGWATLSDARRWHTRTVERLGDDVLLTATSTPT